MDMNINRNSIFDKLSLGYRFSDEREVVSLVYISYFLVLIFGLIVILLHTLEKELLPVTYRYHALMGLGLFELLLLKKRWIAPARILILTVIPTLLLLLPPLAGVTDNEFYFWFPYLPIGLSLIPHFILHPIRHRSALIITLGSYLILGLLIDNYLVLFSEGNEEIIPLVLANRFYYNLIPVFIFLFVNLALGLLFAENYKSEEIVSKQQAELVQAEKMASLGTLTAGIAHEINNPLNFITSSLHAMNTLKEQYLKLEEELSEDKKKILEKIDQVANNSFEGVSRAEEIITKLAFFSNPESEKKEHFNLNAIMLKALAGIESKLPYYIELNRDIPEDIQVYCHAQQLRLVVSHILRNAIDALASKPNKGRETINISGSEEKIDHHPVTRISICNSGPAIPGKDLKYIYDPFFSSKDTGEGTGLGMSLSYMIIREHGGRIEASNDEGMVRFNILLPVVDSGQKAHVKPSA